MGTNDNGHTPSVGATERIQRRYVRHVPFDLIVYRWAVGWLLTPVDRLAMSGKMSDEAFVRLHFWRLRKLKFWFAKLYPHMRKFFVAVLGPRVGVTQLFDRNQACERCPYLRTRLPKRECGKLKRYCAACGCPDWPLSELHWKNRLERWYCPQRRHARATDWQDVMALAIEEQRNAGMETDDSNSGTSPDGTDEAVRQGDVAASIAIG